MSKDINIKIVSDGTSQGTTIVDAETGQNIGGVSKFRFYLDVKKATSVVEVLFKKVPIEFTGKARVKGVAVI